MITPPKKTDYTKIPDDFFDVQNVVTNAPSATPRNVKVFATKNLAVLSHLRTIKDSPILLVDLVKTETIKTDTLKKATVATSDNELTDAKIAAAEARTDTKFGELLSELKLMNQRLNHVEQTTSGVKATVIVTGIAALGLAVAIFGWGSQMFGVGMNAQSIADQAAKSVEQRAAPQINSLNEKYDSISKQMDSLITAIQALKSSETAPVPQQQLQQQKP